MSSEFWEDLRSKTFWSSLSAWCNVLVVSSSAIIAWSCSSSSFAIVRSSAWVSACRSCSSLGLRTFPEKRFAWVSSRLIFFSFTWAMILCRADSADLLISWACVRRVFAWFTSLSAAIMRSISLRRAFILIRRVSWVWRRNRVKEVFMVAPSLLVFWYCNIQCDWFTPNQVWAYYVIIACIILKEYWTENKHWLSSTP